MKSLPVFMLRITRIIINVPIKTIVGPGSVIIAVVSILPFHLEAQAPSLCHNILSMLLDDTFSIYLFILNYLLDLK